MSTVWHNIRKRIFKLLSPLWTKTFLEKLYTPRKERRKSKSTKTISCQKKKNKLSSRPEQVVKLLVINKSKPTPDKSQVVGTQRVKGEGSDIIYYKTIILYKSFRLEDTDKRNAY